MDMRQEIELEEALRIQENSLKTMQTEWIPLEKARGRRLSQDLFAAISQPPFPRSPYDGYALRSDDIKNADTGHGVVLKVIGLSRAGVLADVVVRPGTAVRIMTGAAIPEGADCVIMQEKTDEGEEWVKVFAQVKAFENYCFAGDDFKKGELLLSKGKVMTALSLAIASQAGYDRIPVYPVLTAAVLSTGNELALPGKKLKAGQIYDSNGIWAMERLEELGVEVKDACLADDDCEVIEKELRRLLEMADLVVTTGGISAGKYDLIPAALEAMGAKVLYKGVGIKPGMPTMLALVEGKPVLCLSGNPFAAITAFELLGRHIISVCTGNPYICPKKKRIPAANHFGKRSGTRRFLQGRNDKNGVHLIYQENGLLKNLDGYQYLVEIPAGTPEVPAGTELTVYAV